MVSIHSESSTDEPPPSTKKLRKIICVGINKFANMSWDYFLKGSRNDARLVAWYYINKLQYALPDVEEIHGAQATAAYILQRVQQAVAEYNRVTVFIASHGVRHHRCGAYQQWLVFVTLNSLLCRVSPCPMVQRCARI